jgi:hypothetical protein
MNELSEYLENKGVKDIKKLVNIAQLGDRNRQKK